MRIPAFGARSRLRKPERFSGKRSRFKRTSRKLLRRRYEAYRCRIVYGTQRDGAGTASYRSGRLVSRPRLVGRRDYDLKDRGTSMHRRTARDGVCRRRGTARNLAGASAVCPDARVSLDSSGATGTDYLYNPFRFISSIESSYRSACTCWPSTHRANRSMPASNDQRGENPSSRRAFEMSAKLCRMSPSR